MSRLIAHSIDQYCAPKGIIASTIALRSSSIILNRIISTTFHTSIYIHQRNRSSITNFSTSSVNNVASSVHSNKANTNETGVTSIKIKVGNSYYTDFDSALMQRQYRDYGNRTS